MLKHLCTIVRQAGLKHLYALATPDNEGAPRLLKKLSFPCDVRSDPAQRMMHITDDAHYSSFNRHSPR
jgi:hypothetical protein